LKKEDKSTPAYPLQLFTPQPLLRSHSQYKDLTWLAHDNQSEVLEMNLKMLQEEDYAQDNG
jgi:anaerobic selenocysteine-containing dehydrogenase